MPGDIDKRVKWAEDYLEAAERDFTYPDYILWTDEAIFHLDGHVNRHNAVIRSVQNPHAFMECSNQKKAGVMIWAGLIKDHIELAPSSSMEVSQGKCTFSYYSRGCGQPCKLSCGKRKNLLFSSIMEPQLIMKPMLELGWMESWRRDGWAEGDPYHGQHEVHIYLHWTSSFGVTEKQSVCNAVTTLDKLRQAITDEMQAIPATMVHSATLEVVRRQDYCSQLMGCS